MGKLENQRMQEFALLKAERDSLEKAKKEAEEIGLLREENKRLKRLAKNNKTKMKTVAPAPSSSKPKSNTPTLFAATVPKGIRPGQTFKVSVKGTEYVVICPANEKWTDYSRPHQNECVTNYYNNVCCKSS